MPSSPEPQESSRPPALFVPVDAAGAGPGDWWSATEFARGPWDPAHCHGGPVSAMLARACEQIESPDVDWVITRLTVELTRPVPVGRPLRLAAEVERPGRKVSVVAASLNDVDGIEVAKVRALRVRRRDFPLPIHPTAPPSLTGDAQDAPRVLMSWATDGDQVAFHSHSAEHRVVAGSWDEPGPMSLWVRLTTVLVEGEPLSGVQRAVAAADFGNGVSSAIDYERFLFINPDLTVHLARPPVGEWIGMVSHSRYGTDTDSSGAGFAESELYDADGRVGRSVQSLFVEPR
ncbi:MAG: thioesterase family protein [Ilumatobacter sp.]|uniref:thioesterase family protein n=1 Tax=Ilumatobacter sp. TaxID=1967498 RepID=UPI0032996308